MINFYLVRHGTKENVPFDPPLTMVGVKQAEITAKVFKKIQFDLIIASPKLRTMQTANIIAKFQNKKVIADKRLIERMEWEKDKNFEEFIDEWTKTDLNRNYTPLKGLSSIENGKRMKKVLAGIIEKYKRGNILIVSHGGTIGDLLRELFTESDVEHVSVPETGAKYIKIKECSITNIKYDKEKFNLIKFGDISHLPTPII